MNNSIEHLLAPICADNPTGHAGRENRNIADNLDYDPKLSTIDQLQNILEKAVSTPTAVQPSWEKVRSDSSAILTKASKNLEAALFWTLASIELEGLTGLEDGLALTHGLLNTYWTTLHPVLDEGDPFERVAILELMSLQPLADFGPYRLLHRLGDKQASQGMDLKIGQILAATEPLRWPSPNEGPGLDQIAEIFSDSPESIQATLKQVEKSLVSLNGIKQLFQKNAPGKDAPNLKELQDVLETLQQACNRKSNPGPPGFITSETGGDSGLGASTPTLAVSGRQNALEALNRVRMFFQANEPASPVIPLAELALKLKDRNYLQLVSRVTPTDLELLEKVFGLQEIAPSATVPVLPGGPIQNRQQALETLSALVSVLNELDPSSPVVMLGRVCLSCASRGYAQTCKNFTGTPADDLKELLARKDKIAELAK